MKTTKRARRRQLRENKYHRLKTHHPDFMLNEDSYYIGWLRSFYGDEEADKEIADRRLTMKKRVDHPMGRRGRCYDIIESLEDKAKRELRRLHQDFEEQLELLQHLRDNNWTYDDYWTDDDILRCPCCGQFH